MPLRDDILEPIPGDNPSGESLRLRPIFDKIREARREDDSLAQGAWQRERKVADHALAVRLIQQALATESKDLQLAAWLCEASLKSEGLRGLESAISLCRSLLEHFWDTLHPEIDDGDPEDRLAPLEWLASKLLIPIKSVPLSREGYNFFQYTDSRTVEYEESAKSKDQKTARDKALRDGKLAPEVFDKSFADTPKAFYADLEKQLDGVLEAVQMLDETCVARFGAQSAPSFTKLRETLQDVRRLAHQFLQKKREVEPDPVEPPLAVPVQPEAPQPIWPATVVAGPGLISGEVTFPRPLTEPVDQQEAIAAITRAAAVLRRQDPLNPAPYLLLRGLRWGELRGTRDLGALEAPPGELRRQVKRLALDNRWRDLLDLAENVMALPCSRAWLDLQRFVIEACVALGEEYNDIAVAIRSELRALLRDLPQLIDASLNDDTPAANTETRTWLVELTREPAQQSLASNEQWTPERESPQSPGWRKNFIDPHVRALEAIHAGQALAAIQIMQHEIGRQSSGRGRFRRKLQLARLCLSAGKDAVAQPLLDDIAAEIEYHKLDDWEEREMVAGALAFVLQSSKKIQADAKAKQAIFERVCRLDPAQALSV